MLLPSSRAGEELGAKQEAAVDTGKEPTKGNRISKADVPGLGPNPPAEIKPRLRFNLRAWDKVFAPNP